MTRHYWIIDVLTEPKWFKGQWHYNGVPLVSRSLEYGNSPIRDKQSRLDMIGHLAAANVDFTVRREKL